MPITKADCLLLSLMLCFFPCIVKADPVKTYANQEPSKRLVQPLRIPQQQNGVVVIPQVVNIPPGCFQMGSPETEEGRGTDEVLHRVCVKGFKLAKNEITVEEFRKFITATHFITDAERNTGESGCWSYQKESEKHWNWWPWANWQVPVRGIALIANAPVTCVSLRDIDGSIPRQSLFHRTSNGFQSRGVVEVGSGQRKIYPHLSGLLDKVLYIGSPIPGEDNLGPGALDFGQVGSKVLGPQGMVGLSHDLGVGFILLQSLPEGLGRIVPAR